MRAARRRGADEGLSRDEIAFYDALAENESAVNVMGNIRPELETWPFFTHIEIGNSSLDGLSLVTSVGTAPPNGTPPIAVAEDG